MTFKKFKVINVSCVSHNCPQKCRTMVRQMLGEMSEAERAELLQVKEEKKEEAQDFQQPQQ